MVGNFLRRLGRWAYEHDVRLFHVRVTERILGPKHPDTLASMNNLALVLSNQGKYEQAEEMHRRKLELSETVVGKEHEQPRHSAEISGEVSRSGADVSERTRSEREVLGKEHPHTLASMHNLALVLRDQGKYPEAEQMYRRVVEVRERVLDREHAPFL
jgi:tetratricopeptide (TPR) repeat protein